MMEGVLKANISVKMMRILLVLSLVLLMAFTGVAAAQPVAGDNTSNLDQARRLEREIATLEERLARVQRDWLTISRQLQEVQQRIVESYTLIDAAEAEVEDARRRLNSKLRYLYMQGRQEGLVQLLSSENVSEFMTRYDYLLHVSKQDADFFARVKQKRDKLRSVEEQLLAFKQEAARLARGSDTSGVQALLEQKKNELAQVNGSLMANQVPSTLSAAATDFSPNRIFSQPDENGFVRTGQTLSGYASWYGDSSQGRPTASGEVFEQYGFTCAHRTLPFGTWLRVTFKNRSVIVKVNDRGPFVDGRFMDLSRGAAEAIGLGGVQWVECEIVVPRPVR